VRRTFLVASAALSLGCHLTLGLEDKDFGEATGSGAAAGSGGDGGATGGGGSGGGTGGIMVGGGGSGGGSGGGCESFECGCDFGLSLDDGFDSGMTLEPLMGWDTNFFQEGGVQDGKQYGRYHIKLLNGSSNFWFNAEDSPFVYRKMCGYFGAYTRVEVNDASGGVTPPPPTGMDHGGGLLVRNPMAVEQEWILFSLATDSQIQLRTYIWAAHQNMSDVAMVSGGDSAGGHQEFILGICRLMDGFHFYRKIPGGVAEELTVSLTKQADLPEGEPVTVGITAHRFEDDPLKQVGAYFDYAHFLFHPTTTEQCLAWVDGAP
jgi:hypothetical protein